MFETIKAKIKSNPDIIKGVSSVIGMIAGGLGAIAVLQISESADTLESEELPWIVEEDEESPEEE